MAHSMENTVVSVESKLPQENGCLPSRTELILYRDTLRGPSQVTRFELPTTRR